MKIKVYATPGTVTHAVRSITAQYDIQQLNKEVSERTSEILANPELMEQDLYIIVDVAFEAGFKYAMEKITELIKHNALTLAKIDGKRMIVKWPITIK